jgi:hypothetical protein
MSPLYALKLAAALLVLVFGIISLIAPKRLAASVGLGASEPNGTAEIRIGWGGLYTALGLGALLLRLYPTAFIMLAFAFGGMALTRLLLGFANRALFRNRVYAFALAFEIACALIFVSESYLF